MTFADTLDTLAAAADGATFEIPDGWAQGRATFGGLVVAACLRALRRRVPPERATRGLLVSFVGPVSPGLVTIDTEILRAGRSATQTVARLRQDGETLCLVQAVFGATRTSTIAFEGPPRPTATAPSELDPLPFIPGVTPGFTRHFDYRWTSDALPFQGAAAPVIEGWCRLRSPGAVARDAQIAALVDAWPAPVLPTLSHPAPASSVTWALDLVAPQGPEGDAPDGWWFYASRTDAAAGGFVQAESSLWDPSGHLAARSRQVVAVYA